MSDAGKITVRVSHSRNQETITVGTTGKVGTVPVNTISSKTTYSSRSTATDASAYWIAVLQRVIAELS